MAQRIESQLDLGELSIWARGTRSSLRIVPWGKAKFGLISRAE